MGELSIDLATYGWFPDMLPSEETEIEDDSSDEEER